MLILTTPPLLHHPTNININTTSNTNNLRFCKRPSTPDQSAASKNTPSRTWKHGASATVDPPHTIHPVVPFGNGHLMAVWST
jgi:hypothetical protein